MDKTWPWRKRKNGDMIKYTCPPRTFIKEPRPKGAEILQHKYFIEYGHDVHPLRGRVWNQKIHHTSALCSADQFVECVWSNDHSQGYHDSMSWEPKVLKECLGKKIMNNSHRLIFCWKCGVILHHGF